MLSPERLKKACEFLAKTGRADCRVKGEFKTQLPQPMPACVHLGEPVYRLRTQTIGCSGPVQLYKCRRFINPTTEQPEEVTRRPVAADVQALLIDDGQATPRLRALRVRRGEPETTDPGPHFRPAYKRRTCRGCPEFCSSPREIKQPSDVAVIVPCHNYGRFLRECLESIVAQTTKPAHILVVDDASTDNTPEVAAEFAGRGVGYLRVDFRDASRAECRSRGGPEDRASVVRRCRRHDTTELRRGTAPRNVRSDLRGGIRFGGMLR